MLKGVLRETKFIKGENFKWMKTIIKGTNYEDYKKKN